MGKNNILPTRLIIKTIEIKMFDFVIFSLHILTILCFVKYRANSNRGRLRNLNKVIAKIISFSIGRKIFIENICFEIVEYSTD
ncbi:MAG: hypothetical protein Kow00108_06680 [Calditrichia bacterium]